MHEPLKRRVLVLFAGLMLAFLPGTGMTGCANDTPDEGPGAKLAGQQVITAETIARLKAGEQLVLDLSVQGRVYGFDFSKAPIDFSRISLVISHGNSIRMDTWLSEARQRGHDLLATRAQLFRLSGTKAGTVSAQGEICYFFGVDEYVCDADGNNCYWSYYEIERCYEMPDWDPWPEP